MTLMATRSWRGLDVGELVKVTVLVGEVVEVEPIVKDPKKNAGESFYSSDAIMKFKRKAEEKYFIDYFC